MRNKQIWLGKYICLILYLTVLWATANVALLIHKIKIKYLIKKHNNYEDLLSYKKSMFAINNCRKYKTLKLAYIRWMEDWC